MRVRTTWKIDATPEQLWPLLCGSKMTVVSRSPLFRMGLPRPVECALPNGEGSVGATRQCTSASGQIEQQIVLWEPPTKLQFVMVKTDLPLRHFVKEIVEDFELAKSDLTASTSITRTTNLKFKPGGYFLAAPLFAIGLKTVHRFVFRNWASQFSEVGLTDGKQGS